MINDEDEEIEELNYQSDFSSDFELDDDFFLIIIIIIIIII